MAHPAPALTVESPFTLRAPRAATSALGSWIVVGLGVVALVMVMLPAHRARVATSPYIRAAASPRGSAAAGLSNITARQIAFASDGLPRTTITSADGQFVLNLGNGSIVLDDAERAASVRIVAVDATRLGHIPRGVRANGNAYRVELAYLPSGRTVQGVGAAGTFFMTVPERPTRLLYSPDARSWRRVTSQTGPSPTTVVSPAVDSGYYLSVVALPKLGLVARVRPALTVALVALVWLVFLSLARQRARA